MRAELLQHLTDTARPGVPAGPGGGLSAAVGVLLQGWLWPVGRLRVGRVLLLMARPRSRPRSPRRQAPEKLPGGGPPWPMLRQQQALEASLSQAEQAAAARRAQVLISQGYGPLQAWLSYSGRHEGERSVEAQEPSGTG